MSALGQTPRFRDVRDVRSTSNIRHFRTRSALRICAKSGHAYQLAFHARRYDRSAGRVGVGLQPLPYPKTLRMIVVGDGGYASGPRTAQTSRHRRDRRGWLFAPDGSERKPAPTRSSRHISLERVMPSFGRHGGRVVKSTGDGVLAEFGSTVDALSALIELQQGMTNANREQPEADRIVFRAGVHLGEVIVEDSDLYGDAVNIAARLEGEAPPGGILISRAVREAASGRIKAEFQALGELSLKNIERPIRAFRVEWKETDWPTESDATTEAFWLGSHASSTSALATIRRLRCLRFEI